MYKDLWITDFTTPGFQAAFQEYFAELGICVKDWEGLFREMNQDANGPNYAWLRQDGAGQTIGFIQFCIAPMKSWFFTVDTGFIREFWITNDARGAGQGSQLLSLAEQWFRQRGIRCVMLTSDQAGPFYEKHGYEKRADLSALNHDPVYVKDLC